MEIHNWKSSFLPFAWLNLHSWFLSMQFSTRHRESWLPKRLLPPAPPDSVVWPDIVGALRPPKGLAMCPATVTRLSYLTPHGDDGSCCPFEGGARAEKLVKKSGREREREYKFLAASEGGGRLHRTETGRCGTGPSSVRATGSQVWQSPLDARASQERWY